MEYLLVERANYVTGGLGSGHLYAYLIVCTGLPDNLQHLPCINAELLFVSELDNIMRIVLCQYGGCENLSCRL
jgi:hypothetical protein